MKFHFLLPSSLMLTATLLIGCGSSDSSEPTVKSTPNTSPVTAQLLINEVVYSAKDGGEDWIELYAMGGTVNLSTYSLVDDDSEHSPKSLPDITLSEGEFIVIQALGDTDTAPTDAYYVNFKLGSTDSITLFNNGEQVEQLTWEKGAAPEGASYGYLIEGVGQAEILSPTPGAVNQEHDPADLVIRDQTPSDNPPLRINEIVAKDSDDGHDWIEFYVSGDNSVYLGDYSIADENNVLSDLPAITLASGEYYRVYATDQEIEDNYTVNMKLGAKDQLNLYLDVELVDQLAWDKGQALEDYSFGRFPDGSDSTQTLTPTAVQSNLQASHGPLVINEVVASDIDGGSDWFELVNTSDENISLANYKVIDENDDIEPVMLPDVVLIPNEYIVIYATDEDPHQHYVPFKLGKNDELKLILNDKTVDFIDWKETDVAPGFSYGLTGNNNNWEKDTLTPSKGLQNVAVGQ